MGLAGYGKALTVNRNLDLRTGPTAMPGCSDGYLLVMVTHPPPALGVGASGFCSGPLGREATVVSLGDLAFHATCVPNCYACGCALEPDLEVGWTHQELVVPSAHGYDCMPCHHLCPNCCETTLHDEPSAQD